MDTRPGAAARADRFCAPAAIVHTPRIAACSATLPGLGHLLPSPAPSVYVDRPMRGRRRTVAAALAEALARTPGARTAALAAAFAEACGPRVAHEASFRGPLADGRLLVVVRTAAWAEQIAALEREICARVEARVGRGSAPGLHIRVGEPR